MTVEIQLKKMLVEKGFYEKKTKIGSVWTYDHNLFRTVNYDIHGDIWFNYLAIYMRNEANRTHGNIVNFSRTEKEHIYRQVLSKMKYYKDIKNNLKFSLRKQGSGDYVGISDKVGIGVFGEILQFIISGSGLEGLPSPSPRIISEKFLPDWSFVKTVIDIDLIDEEAPTIDQILDAIASKCRDKDIVLMENWREITRRNIPLWLAAQSE